MDISEAKLTLKVLGILNIITGIFGIVFGAGLFVGTSLLGEEVFGSVTTGAAVEEGVVVATGLSAILAVFVLIEGVIYLLEGIFAVRASGGDPNKVGPAYVFSIIGIGLSILILILNLVSGPTVNSIISSLLGTVFSVLVFRAASAIKNNA